MFMNLDTLPAGTSLFTVYVTTDPEGTNRSEIAADEVDVLAPSSSTWGQVCNDGIVNTLEPGQHYANAYIHDAYGEDARILGVVNQSGGYVVFDAFAEGMETGANDL